MILDLINGEIKVKQNSVESFEKAMIHLNFKDRIISQSDVITLFIDDKKVESLEKNMYKIEISDLMKSNNQITVTVVTQEHGMFIYKSFIEIKKSFSLGDMPHNKYPQVIIDQYKRIEDLEKRIKTLENKGTVI